MLVAMKGIYPHEELAQMPAQFTVEKILQVPVPGLEAQRHLVLIRRA
jgi:16S rRNA (guanine527-N7)-methyltransferase